jgi:hypothetical protein
MRDIARSIYLLGILAIVAMVETVAIYNVVLLPLTNIVTQVSGGPAQ